MTATVTPIQKLGNSRTGTLHASYADILATVGKPNTTKIDDPCKVPASWGFQSADGRTGHIWAYRISKRDIKTNDSWSVDGDKSLLRELFGADAISDGIYF